MNWNDVRPILLVVVSLGNLELAGCLQRLRLKKISDRIFAGWKDYHNSMSDVAAGDHLHLQLLFLSLLQGAPGVSRMGNMIPNERLPRRMSRWIRSKTMPPYRRVVFIGSPIPSRHSLHSGSQIFAQY